VADSKQRAAVFAGSQMPVHRLKKAGAGLGLLPKFSTPVEKTVEKPDFRWSCCGFYPVIVDSPDWRRLETLSQHGVSPIFPVTSA